MATDDGVKLVATGDNLGAAKVLPLMVILLGVVVNGSCAPRLLDRVALPLGLPLIGTP